MICCISLHAGERSVRKVSNFLTLTEKKGIIKCHKTVQTRVYAAVSITVCQIPKNDCFASAHRNTGYDMDFEGTFYASNVFVRDMAWASTELD